MTAETLHQIEEEIGSHERFVLGKRTEYKLFRGVCNDRVGYLIGISRDGESEKTFVGEDFLGVAVLFAQIVRGEVLPYTLAEIAEDFRKEEKIYSDKNS